MQRQKSRVGCRDLLDEPEHQQAFTNTPMAEMTVRRRRTLDISFRLRSAAICAALTPATLEPPISSNFRTTSLRCAPASHSDSRRCNGSSAARHPPNASSTRIFSLL
ncbi:hypothetical protein SRHO_G00320550 [Serrasalmus rhombeus]